MWPGPRPTSVPTSKWHLDPSSRLAISDMGRKLGMGCAPFLRWGVGWGWGSVDCDEAYLHTKLHLDPSSRLDTTQYANVTDRTGQTDSIMANSLRNGRPKIQCYKVSSHSQFKKILQRVRGTPYSLVAWHLLSQQRVGRMRCTLTTTTAVL